MTVGTLIAFSVYLARATGPVQTLLGLYVAMRRARVSLHRVIEVTRVEPAVSTPARPEPIPASARGEIQLERVSFSYEGEGREVLSQADLV